MRGSPPPTRGTPFEESFPTIPLRITPAYAGNTYKLIKIFFCCQDHPRLRGEHAFEFQKGFGVGGSPPPTRGTLWRLKDALSLFGITPAYAGNTRRKRLNNFFTEDHPRLRGEHYLRWLVKDMAHRITPAYAGNTDK